METFLIIAAAALVVIFILKSFISGNKEADNTSRPSEDQLPSAQKDNDKIILVKNVNHDDIKNALTKFCNIYNKNDFAALPRLWQLSTNSFAITFPYDVDFVTYCFAVNFMKYPTDIKWNADVKAWATTKPNDEWITEKTANKSVMLFLADDDKEYDNVFLTSQDDIGYKLGFAMGEEKQLLPNPKEKYVLPDITQNQLQGPNFEDFK